VKGMSRKGSDWGYVFPWAAVSIAVLATAYALWSPTMIRCRELGAREERLAAEVHAMWARGVRLERTRDALRSDPVMLENVARNWLGYARSGEVVHQITRAPEAASFTEPEQATPDRTGWVWATAREAALPTLVLLAAGLGLALFFANLSLREQPAPVRSSPNP